MVRPTRVMRRGWHAVTPFVLITMACGDPQGPNVDSSPAAVGGFAIRTFTSDAAPQSGSAAVAAYVSGPGDVA